MFLQGFLQGNIVAFFGTVKLAIYLLKNNDVCTDATYMYSI